jgi:hypothetical protein
MADNTQEQSNARSLNELNKSNLALQKEINAAKERQLALIKKENELKKTSGKLDEKEAKELKEITTNLVVLNKQRALGLTLAKEMN